MTAVEPNDCIRFTSASIHVDHTYEELPLNKPPTPSTPFVSTFKTGKKFGSLCERSKDDSDLHADYDDTRASSTDMFGSFRNDLSRRPVVEPTDAFASTSIVHRPPFVLPPHPPVQTSDRLPPLLPKSSERKPPPAPLTLPKSSGPANVSRPPPPFPTLDAAYSRSFDGLTAGAGRARLGSGSLQVTRNKELATRTSLDHDSGYSTNPDAPLTIDTADEHDSDYFSINDTGVPQPPPSKPKEPRNTPKTYASKTVPRSRYQLVGAAEISASPARLRCDSPYEDRPVPQPPSLIWPNTEQQRQGGIDVPAKTRSQSKSSPKASTDRLFEPGSRSSIGETPWSGIPDTPPPPVKPVQKASRVSDRIVPAAPRLKKNETTTASSSSNSSDSMRKVCPPVPPVDDDAPSSFGTPEGGSDVPLGRPHVPRPKTAHQVKPRKSSPKAKPKSPSPPPPPPTRNTAVSHPDATLHLTPSNSESNCAGFDVTGTKDFQIILTSGLVAESTWSADDYEQTHRSCETSETLGSDYELFRPKCPETPQPSKPKPTPPLPECPAASRPREDRSNAGAIERTSDIPQQLSGLSCSQMADCLRLLNMEAYVEGFLANQIDGKLLLELDESILTTDLKVSRLNARKLLVFAHQGWRP